MVKLLYPSCVLLPWCRSYLKGLPGIQGKVVLEAEKLAVQTEYEGGVRVECLKYQEIEDLALQPVQVTSQVPGISAMVILFVLGVEKVEEHGMDIPADGRDLGIAQEQL